MEITERLSLKISTDATFEDDDIKQTIVGYGENFKTIDEVLAKSASNSEDLNIGERYGYGVRVWDSTPSIGEYIGWVNVREGVYAPEWKPLEEYVLGELVRATPDNGNVYKCIVEGRSMMNTPTFLTNDNVEFYDANGNKWSAEYNYEVDDVVFSTDSSSLFYYICETAGLSSTEEPDWGNTPVGTTVIDGSVVWRKEKTVKWKQVDDACNFRPFGKIE